MVREISANPPRHEIAEDLRQFFIEEPVESPRGFSPRLAAYRRGALGADGASERFVVEEDALGEPRSTKG
jgi:hypothetical protein